MDNTAPLAVVYWVICIIFVIILWYRDSGLDRFYSIFVFFLSLIFLIQYGLFYGLSPDLAYRLLLIVFFFQILVVYCGLFYYNQSLLYGGLAILAFVVYILFWIYNYHDSSYMILIYGILIFIGLLLFLTVQQTTIFVALTFLLVIMYACVSTDNFFVNKISLPVNGDQYKIDKKSLLDFCGIYQFMIIIIFVIWIIGML